MIEFDPNLKPDASEIGVIIFSSVNTEVYIFEGDRTNPINMEKNGKPAIPKKIYTAPKGSTMLVISQTK